MVRQARPIVNRDHRVGVPAGTYLPVMIVPPARRVRLIRSRTPAAGRLPAALASDGWPARAEVLKQDERSSVLAGESPAGPVVVKSLLLDRRADALKRAVGGTRLLRQWRGAEMLARYGFAVARPLVLWRGRDERGRVVESLAMERLHGRTIIELMADHDLPRNGAFALARALGEQTARLAMLGLVNRDHKPSNLLVVLSEPEAQARDHEPLARAGGDSGASASLARASGSDVRIAILDTVAIRRANPWNALAHMLFELIVEPIGCGVAPSPALRRAAARAAARTMGLPADDALRLWREVRARLDRHGDATPRVSPVG